MEIDVTKNIKRRLLLSCFFFIVFIISISYIFMYENKKSDDFSVSNAYLTFERNILQAPNSLIVQEIHVTQGEYVTKGTLLFVIQNIFTDEEISRLQKNVEIAQKNLEQLQFGVVETVPNTSGSEENLESAHQRMLRMNELYEIGAVSAAKRNEAVELYEREKNSFLLGSSQNARKIDPKVIQIAEAQLKRAEQSLNNAKKNIQTTKIYAQEKGIVSDIFVKEGDQLEKGADILEIEDIGNSYIETVIEGKNVNQVYLGQLVQYELNGISLQGTVKEISDIMPERDDDNAVMEKRIRISVPQEKIQGDRGDTDIVLHFHHD